MTKEQKKEEAVNRIMSGLKCSREEAEQVYNCDQKIDRGERTDFDLPASKLKTAKKFARTGTREKKTPTVYKFDKRERKANATKGGIIEEVAGFIGENSGFLIENLQIPNKEGKISFKVGEKWYTFTLTEHRIKPKWINGD